MDKAADSGFDCRRSARKNPPGRPDDRIGFGGGWRNAFDGVESSGFLSQARRQASNDACEPQTPVKYGQIPAITCCQRAITLSAFLYERAQSVKPHMIRDRLLPLLAERFPGRFAVAEQGVEPFVTFPAKHPEVGEGRFTMMETR